MEVFFQEQCPMPQLTVSCHHAAEAIPQGHGRGFVRRGTRSSMVIFCECWKPTVQRGERAAGSRGT